MEVEISDHLFSDELIAADSGIDFAFQLQMQEAIRASLTSSSSSNDVVSRVYFKGLVSNETITNIKMSFAGIGVAICDANDFCLHESRQSFLLDAGGRGTEGDIVELEALIEALNLAVNLGLNRVIIFCDCNSVYEYVSFVLIIIVSSYVHYLQLIEFICTGLINSKLYTSQGF